MIINYKYIFSFRLKVESFVPHVVEPSFGLGRILTVLLEHNFCTREADGRRFFTFPVSVSPYKAAVMTIVKSGELDPIAERICSDLASVGVDFKSDCSGKVVGKKYSLMDEIGVNYSIVLDYDTIRHSPPSVTIRDRDTLNQIRVQVDDVARLIKRFVDGEVTFDEATKKYLMQEEYARDPTQLSRLEKMKSAHFAVTYTERDIGKLLSSLSEVAIQLNNPMLLTHVHNFKREMQNSCGSDFWKQNMTQVETLRLSYH